MAIKIRRIDFSADEWLAGTVGMTAIELGVYWQACALIYSRGGGPITSDLITRSISGDPRPLKRAIARLIAWGKLDDENGNISQKRCEKEVKISLTRIETFVNNGLKGGRPSSKINGVTKPGGFSENNRAINLKIVEREIAPQESYISLSTARDTSPPPAAPKGRVVAAPRAPTIKAEPAAPTALDDPEVRTEAIAALGRCLDALHGKAVALGTDATGPPPDPRIALFAERLRRLNAFAGKHLRGAARLQAWEIIGQADALGDPMILPAALAADLAAIEQLGTYAEAAE